MRDENDIKERWILRMAKDAIKIDNSNISEEQNDFVFSIDKILKYEYRNR